MYNNVKKSQETYELKLFPLDHEEFIGTVRINGAIPPVEKSKSVQTVIILDQSGRWAMLHVE